MIKFYDRLVNLAKIEIAEQNQQINFIFRDLHPRQDVTKGKK